MKSVKKENKFISYQQIATPKQIGTLQGSDDERVVAKTRRIYSLIKYLSVLVFNFTAFIKIYTTI